LRIRTVGRLTSIRYGFFSLAKLTQQSGTTMIYIYIYVSGVYRLLSVVFCIQNQQKQF